MNKLLSVLVVFAGLAASANQIVINVPNEDFSPLKQAQWKVMAGSTATSFIDGNHDRSARGLGVAVERQMFFNNLNLGASYALLKSDTTFTLNGVVTDKYTEVLNTATVYGKYSFVNMSINKWNQLQLNLIGGAQWLQHMNSTFNAIYGASVSYNYDNVLGFEIESKVNTSAVALTSANLIGYF